MKYTDHIVAFIDILGFKEMIFNSSKNPDMQNIIWQALNYLKKLEKNHEWVKNFMTVEEDAQRKNLNNFHIDNLIKVTCFSDSILISLKIEEKRFNEIFSTLVAYVAFIGNFLIRNGILIRGGITIGDLVHTKNGIVYGSGLIKAYELESKTAIYPRIIISKELKEKLNYPLMSKKERYPYHQYLKRFEDGCFGFDQLIILQVMDSLVDDLFLDMFGEEKVTLINKVKDVILNGLNNNFENISVFNKYNWLKESFNDLILFTNINREKIAIPRGSFHIYYECSDMIEIKREDR